MIVSVKLFKSLLSLSVVLPTSQSTNDRSIFKTNRHSGVVKLAIVDSNFVDRQVTRDPILK